MKRYMIPRTALCEGGALTMPRKRFMWKPRRSRRLWFPGKVKLDPPGYRPPAAWRIRRRRDPPGTQ